MFSFSFSVLAARACVCVSFGVVFVVGWMLAINACTWAWDRTHIRIRLFGSFDFKFYFVSIFCSSFTLHVSCLIIYKISTHVTTSHVLLMLHTCILTDVCYTYTDMCRFMPDQTIYVSRGWLFIVAIHIFWLVVSSFPLRFFAGYDGVDYFNACKTSTIFFAKDEV